VTITIYTGDCMDVLKTLPAESVHCVVTSPPYYGLRDYGVEGQIGLEDTPDAYIAKLVAVFREVRRVLRADGTVWLNLGDSYVGYKGDNYNSTGKRGTGERSEVQKAHNRGTPHTQPLAAKQLMMIPARVALALQADGWWLRSQIIWHKPNAMPESVTDRPTTDYEMVYLLAKQARYYYDADAVREPYNEGSLSRYGYEFKADVPSATATKNPSIGAGKIEPNPAGRNRRAVWTIPTRPFSEAHFATFPPDLVEPMVKAGTSERGCCPECGKPWERVTERVVLPPADRIHNNGFKHDAMTTHGEGAHTLRNIVRQDTVGWRATCNHDAEPVPCTVLDPFGGAGTVGLVADRLGRDAILVELNPAYAEMAAWRIHDDAGMFAEVVRP
jgi:DNA modification methylase